MAKETPAGRYLDFDKVLQVKADMMECYADVDRFTIIRDEPR
jgi:hypothetical protein